MSFEELEQYVPPEETRQVLLEVLQDAFVSIRANRHTKESQMNSVILADILHNVPTLLQGRTNKREAKRLLAFLEEQIPSRMADARKWVAERALASNLYLSHDDRR
jgi:hypothetical protein